ncbi:hypothetical protein D6C86_01203 [Aureobasidium pullulans]|uniref:Uncharacterized protein n=1 Tax=Aureobasidium pullulans TaxID=5580 RepID=A0A4T0D5P4_AURPU|nr:hypothetical protein D6C94_10418 [Aureobasidium pullulans]THZ38346.1 hypothetical protein D6C87_07873 [Aureobasidium pullulans]THZ66346.1 hypothetical protein D6C86_01203 [Aureobasidium pullulans]THZ94813.1 hypothetical protein D6C88_02166 [Aureobasidium pullulans]TIA56288.1 hypothetical protein D6C79_00037 [Aureobasidium pullulans]
MSNNDLQSILARHNLKGINVANFSQPRAHQPTASRPQPYQYPAPVPQPQQVYQYPAVPRQQWAPPAEAARQQVRPSFAWPSAPQPQYTIDPRHYSYNIWGKAPVYSLTGEDEEENEESEDEGEGESEGGDDGIAVEDVDADAGTKAEESIDAEKAGTQHIVTDEPTEKTSTISSDKPASEDSATPVEEDTAAEPAKEEPIPEPPSEDPPSEPIKADTQPAVAEEPPVAPSSEEEEAADSSATTSPEPDPVPEASQDSAAPAPAEEEALESGPAVEDPVSSENADADAQASEENIEVVHALAEEQASEEPAVAAVLPNDETPTADTVATIEATGTPDSEDEAVPGADIIEDAAEAPEPAGDTPTVDDPPKETPPSEDSPSQDSSTKDLSPVDSPDKDTAEEVPPSAEPSPADQDAETISEPEPQSDVTPAPEPDSVAVDEPTIEAVEQQPPATEIENQPVEVAQVIDNTDLREEPATIVIDVGGVETISDNTVVIVDVPPSNPDAIIDVPPPPPPAPHVTIAEPMKPSKVSSKKNSSKSSKSRQPEKPKEVKPVEIIPLKEGRPRTAAKSKGKVKKSRGKVVEKAMKVFEDSPPPPPLVVAVPEDAAIDVPPPAPSPPPAESIIEVAGVEEMQIIDVVDEDQNIEETAAEVESIAAFPEEEAAGHQDQDTVAESLSSCSSDPEPAAEPISTSPSEESNAMVEQADSIAVELPEAVQEVAVSAEPPVEDLALADATTDETVAKDAIDGDAVETMSPAIPPPADDSESIVDEPCASVQEAMIGDGPATIEEGLAETSEETVPAETTELDVVDSAVEKTVDSIAMEDSSGSDDTTAISVEPAAEKPELVAESAADLVESTEFATSTEPVLESEAEIVIVEMIKESSAGDQADPEVPVLAHVIPDAEPNTDDAHDGALVVIVHPGVEEGIDTDVEILPEAPMPPDSQLSEAEGESGGGDEDGGEEQQNMSGEPTTEPIDREEAEEFSAPQAADAIEMGAADVPNPVEEDPVSVLDSSTVKPEAEKVEASDQSEPLAATPNDREDATPVSPIETPDAAVDIPPADQDALSAHEEAESPKIIDTPQAPPDQKLEDEATEHVEKAVDPVVAEDAVDEGEEPAQTEQEAVVVAEAGAPEQLPTEHDATTSEGTSQPAADEPAAQDPAVDQAVIEEPAAAEVREPVTDAAVEEPAADKLAADAIEEPVMPEPAVEDHALHKEASEPVADDPTGTVPCETITEQSVITDLDISAEDKPPEEVAQTTTDYIPEAPAETTVKDPEKANNAASSTEGTVGQEEGGIISNKPSLQVLVEDVQSSSAKALLEERTAPSLSDHGDHQDQDPVPTEPVVEKSLEPDEEPSPRLPSIAGAAEDAPEAAEPGPSAPSHGFAAREEENFGPQDSISERGQPMGEPQLGSVYTEHPFVAEMSGALPPKSAAPSGSIPYPTSRASNRGPPAGPASIHPSKASAREPVASSSTSKRPSRASPPKDKRRSVHSTRTKVKDVSRPTGDPEAPVEITRRTTIKTTPPTNFLGMRSSGSKHSRQPSNIDDLKRQADDLAAREKETRRKIAEAEQRAEIADRARKLREQEAKLAFLHQAEAAAAKKEERRKREREERESESARLRHEEAKVESSRNTEHERAARRHRRRHGDRVSESHRRHRDERPRARKHSSSHRDEQVREQSPHPQPSSQPQPREPREPKVRRYRAEEVGTERRKTEDVDAGEEVYTRARPEPSRRPEERRRRSHRESRKEEKPKGLFGSLKSVFKKL